MILAGLIIALVVFGLYIAYEFMVLNRLMDESENRIIKMLDKAVDNVNIFFIGLWASFWSSDDHDEDELTD